jgi:preprotein translocase subunit SecF
MLRIIQNRAISFTFSGILIAISVVSLLIWGLKPGLDFTGGSQLVLSFSSARPTPAQVVDVAKPIVGAGETTAQPLGDQDVSIRMPALSEAKHQDLMTALRAKFEVNGVTITEKSFDSIGPIIGIELQHQTMWAVIFAILGIVIYVTFAFRHVSFPVASWKYGASTIIALIHDVTVPLGALSILGHFAGLEVGAWVVTALLTVLGFSVHDTIVVFDRIRENLGRYRKDGFEELVNKSINETLARSINTSFTVLLTLLAAYVFGGASTKDFILTLLIGIFFGTYSSIFIASPLLVTWHLHDLDRRHPSKKR